MKYIIFLGDGMADEPKTCKNGLTPLMVANTPNMDLLLKKSKCGQLITIPQDMPAGSSVANMSILGYDSHDCYEGRGVLEAASMGIDIKNDEVGLRCNLICIDNDKIKSHSAGHISTQEADELIKYLNDKLGNDEIKFHTGISYRHLLVIKNGNKNVKLIPPHDELGTEFLNVMPKSINDEGKNTTKLLSDLILKSQEILNNHPINQNRIAQGKDPANSIWPWSIGKKPNMQTMNTKYGITGAVISAVDLINGLGKYAGLDVINVVGATGLYDTNYEGKADACLEAIKKYDFVYVHVEASDEAGHEGDFDLKVKTIEYLDKRLIGMILEKLGEVDDEVKIGILPDHPTPVALKTHTREPVPFMITQLDGSSDGIVKMDEITVKKGSYGLIEGEEFIKTLLGK